MSAPAAFSDIAKAANDVCYSLPQVCVISPRGNSTIQPGQINYNNEIKSGARRNCKC